MKIVVNTQLNDDVSFNIFVLKWILYIIFVLQFIMFIDVGLSKCSSLRLYLSTDSWV